MASLLFINSIHLLWFYPSLKIGFHCLYPSHFDKITDKLHFSQQCYYVSSVFQHVWSSFLYFLAYVMLWSYFTVNFFFTSFAFYGLYFFSWWLFIFKAHIFVPLNMLEICWKCWTRPHDYLLVLGRWVLVGTIWRESRRSEAQKSEPAVLAHGVKDLEELKMRFFRSKSLRSIVPGTRCKFNTVLRK